MNQLLQTTAVRIGEYDFQIGKLAFEDARPAYVRLQKLLSADDKILAEVAQDGVGLFMFAGFGGLIDDEDLKYYTELFGKVTTVAVSAQQTVFLKDKAARDLLFGGQIEIFFEWLDACVEVNFAGARAKLGAVGKRLLAIRTAKAEAEKNK